MAQSLDIEKVRSILSRHYIGYLSYSYMNNPFVVPTSYFYDPEEEILIGYTAKGHKTDCMRKNPAVAFLVDEIDSLEDWRSVVVYGKYDELSGTAAKLYLRKFCEGLKKQLGDETSSDYKFLCDFTSKAESKDPPIVYRIKIKEYTARHRND